MAEPAAEYHPLTPQEADKRIKQLEDKMYAAARDLQFEEAARLRDEIRRIQSSSFGV